MPTRVLHPKLTAPCSPLDPRWQLVQRVAASQFFAKGPKLRAFLLYSCENSLLGKPENLTAQLIGTRVFGRDPDYIPSEDNIVRVEARELRKRLAAYFASDGRDEPVILDIPKGSYSPVFLSREAAQAEAGLPFGAADPELAEAVSHRAHPWLIASLAGALALAVAIIVWQAVSSPFRKAQAVFLAGLHQSAASSLDFSIYNELLGPAGRRTPAAMPGWSSATRACHDLLRFSLRTLTRVDSFGGQHSPCRKEFRNCPGSNIERPKDRKSALICSCTSSSKTVIRALANPWRPFTLAV